MALNIKDPETDRLARELALATGETITVAVRRAIEERLRRVQASSASGLEAQVQAIIDRGRSRTLLDERSAEEREPQRGSAGVRARKPLWLTLGSLAPVCVHWGMV